MELARLSAKGQITVPVEIRKKLNLKEGDKVLFLEEGDKILIVNASLVAFKEMQQTMEGEAKSKGIKSEDDINKLVKEVRKGIWEKKYENND